MIQCKICDLSKTSIFVNMSDLLLNFLNILSSLPFIIFGNLYLSRQIYRLYFNQTKCTKNEVLFCFDPLTPTDTLKKAFLLFFFVVILLLPHIWLGSWPVFLVFLLILVLFQFIIKPSLLENKQITNVKNLTLGYGAALWYFRNYLDRFLEQNLSKRVKTFKSFHIVELPEKLYILCPLTCKVKEYIDNTPFIDRCRELPPLIKDNSGIVKREYNITVYRIQHPQQTFRCAIEYAQPLKSLLRFKEMGRISTNDLCAQREEFCKHLNEFLRDGGNTRTLCELVEFDDEVENIHDVLFNLCSIQQFIKETHLK